VQLAAVPLSGDHVAEAQEGLVFDRGGCHLSNRFSAFHKLIKLIFWGLVWQMLCSLEAQIVIEVSTVCVTHVHRVSP
jgi:hypothetical protein